MDREGVPGCAGNAARRPRPDSLRIMPLEPRMRTVSTVAVCGQWGAGRAMVRAERSMCDSGREDTQIDTQSRRSDTVADRAREAVDTTDRHTVDWKQSTNSVDRWDAAAVAAASVSTVTFDGPSIERSC